MCFVLVLYQVRPDYPLIVAANREERRDRASTPPFRWDGEPAIWAGRDEVAGGTWLGVNSAGLVAAITNRPERPADPSLPSRGALCLSALREVSPPAALDVVSDRLKASPYNAFNLVCANPHEGWVTTWRGDARPLSPGIHVVSNRGEPDDSHLPHIRRARALLKRVDLEAPSLEALFTHLGRLCANTRGRAPICRPAGDRGTVSSSLIALHPSGQIAAYWHANGPPSEAPYQPVGSDQINRDVFTNSLAGAGIDP